MIGRFIAIFAAAVFTTSIAHAQIRIAPSNVPTPDTVVALTANVDAVLGSVVNRRYLCLQNIGTGLVTLGFDHAAVVGSGWALEAATAAGHQGGGMCWEAGVATGSVVHAISAAGSTVVVVEGQ